MACYTDSSGDPFLDNATLFAPPAESENGMKYWWGGRQPGHLDWTCRNSFSRYWRNIMNNSWQILLFVEEIICFICKICLHVLGILMKGEWWPNLDLVKFAESANFHSATNMALYVAIWLPQKSTSIPMSCKIQNQFWIGTVCRKFSVECWSFCGQIRVTQTFT